jgi:hypothetical protein
VEVKKAKWENLTDMLTLRGLEELQVGQILIFDYEGSKIYMKIMRKRHGKLWAKEITTYNPDQIDIVDKK